MRRCPKCGLKYYEARQWCLVDGATLDPASDPLLGKTLGGRYVIEDILGEGGMATVYRAHHALVDRVFAVKVLHPELAEDPALRERLRREAKSTAAVAHPNIVEIYDFGLTDDDRPYVVMELLDGLPLNRMIGGKPMPPEEVVELGMQIAQGLARAHDFGIVHRDLKPENVFVVEDPFGHPLVKLVDFGIAVAPHDARLTVTGQVIGTPQYMAPERATSPEARPSADLYSLGVVMFEMVTGTLPFHSPSMTGYVLAHISRQPPKPSDLAPSCPPTLEGLILKLLEKDPNERPVDAHQVVRVLEALQPETRAPVPSTRPAVPRETTVTLDRWNARVAMFQEIMRRAYPDGPPPDVRRDLDQLQAKVKRLTALRKDGVDAQRELERLSKDAYEKREQLGHAVHTLAVDLSQAREAARAAQLEAEARQRAVEDLEFQIRELGGQLGNVEATLDERRLGHESELKRNATERHDLEHGLAELVHRLGAPLRGQAELRDLFERLGRAT